VHQTNEVGFFLSNAGHFRLILLPIASSSPRNFCDFSCPDEAFDHFEDQRETNIEFLRGLRTAQMTVSRYTGSSARSRSPFFACCITFSFSSARDKYP